MKHVLLQHHQKSSNYKIVRFELFWKFAELTRNDPINIAVLTFKCHSITSQYFKNSNSALNTQYELHSCTRILFLLWLPALRLICCGKIQCIIIQVSHVPNVPQVEQNFKCHHRRNACKYKTFKPQYGVLVWISVIYHNIVRKENLGLNGLKIFNI